MLSLLVLGSTRLTRIDSTGRPFSWVSEAGSNSMESTAGLVGSPTNVSQLDAAWDGIDKTASRQPAQAVHVGLIVKSHRVSNSQ